MLETIMNSYAIFWAMGVVAALGVICKIITVFTLKRLVRASSKMGKSTHKLMKLVKAKFEHAVMLSDRVENTHAFVEKYLYEYRVFGLRLHSWRHLGRQTIWLCGFLGFAGALFSYRQIGMEEITFRYGVIGGLGMVLLFLVRISTDELHQLEAVQMYMIDYLENVCAPRYEKQQSLKYQRMEKTINGAAVEPEVKEELSPEPEIKEEKKEKPEVMEAKHNEPEGIMEERIEEEKIREERMRAERIREEKVKAERLREERIREDRIREERIREEKMMEEDMKEQVEDRAAYATDEPIGQEPEMQPEHRQRVPQEVILREILEEFLA